MHLQHLMFGCSTQPDKDLGDSAPAMAACWQLNDMSGSGHVTWEWYRVCAELFCAM